MRHRVAYRKLGRVTEHRIAMLRNQASALIEHEHIETTVARAKELRPFVERIISVAKRSLSAPAGSSHHVTARRTVGRDIADRAVLQKLFDAVAPKYVDRAGGYTRLLRLGHRRGDAAEVAQVELVGFEFSADAVKDKGSHAASEPSKKKTVGGRIREALTGGRKKKDEAQQAPKAKPDKAAKGSGRRSTTPRKAGGS